jgi:hypothetical protein
MTDWNKSKVTDLRAELKSRGLAQTGLKPVLVARLTEAENAESESEATVQGDASKLDTLSPESVSPTQHTIDSSIEASSEIPRSEPPVEPPVTQDPAEPPTSDSSNLADSSQPPSQVDTHDSSLPSVEPSELLGDLQKRKRRSQSPIPSSEDVAHKRGRHDDVQMRDEVVTTQDDSTWVEKHNGVDAAESNAGSQEVAPPGNGAELGPTSVDTAMKGMAVETVTARKEQSTPVKPVDENKDPKDSPSQLRDSRFKGLFSVPQGPAVEVSKSRDSELVDVQLDRDVSPAIHPATAALYIRDIMRPLNPVHMKNHLTALATPPGQDVDPSIIVEFYLDPIRTHAFISLKNTSAASRIRTSLHDRIWPDERNRKRLFVDFIPFEKVDEFIKEEEASQPEGRGLAKKWEIIYDTDEDRQVTAYLQEVSAIQGRQNSVRQPSISGPVQAPVVPVGHSRSISGAPLGPRADSQRARFISDDEASLDARFNHTDSVPKIYWKPVDKTVVDMRLDKLEDIKSKDYDPRDPPGDQINRYTFENDELVDRGLEMFPGIRPPRGFRGPVFGDGRPPRGQYGGRGGHGGGYGGDSYAGRGDSYRGGGRDAYRPGGDDRRHTDRRW